MGLIVPHLYMDNTNAQIFLNYWWPRANCGGKLISQSKTQDCVTARIALESKHTGALISHKNGYNLFIIKNSDNVTLLMSSVISDGNVEEYALAKLECWHTKTFPDCVFIDVRFTA